MIWQVPALSVAAQAFLYGTAFDPNVTDTARLLVTAVALVVALATLQLLLKHRYHEEIYSFALDQSRKERGVERLYPLVREVAFRVDEEKPIHRWNDRWLYRRFVKLQSSSKLWIWVLVAFVIVDVAVMTSVIARWDWFAPAKETVSAQTAPIKR